MKRNSSEAVVYTDSVVVQERSSVEIDLYPQLVQFEQLTPDVQARLAVHPEIEASQDNPTENDPQSTEYPSDLADAPTYIVDLTIPEKDSVAEEMEQRSLTNEEEVDQESLSEGASVTNAQIDDKDSSENELLLVHTDSTDEFEALEIDSESLKTEQAEAVNSESDLDSTATAQNNVQEGSKAIETQSDISVTPSGPLESLDGAIEFSGDISRGVCLACGADAPTDDLFCLACGVFIEDIT